MVIDILLLAEIRFNQRISHNHAVLAEGDSKG